MKKIIPMMLFVAMLAMAGRLQAQGCQGGHDHSKHHGSRTEMMRETLGLSDAQVKQMDAIHEKYSAQIKALWATESTDHDAQIEKMKAIHKAKRTEIHAMLTPEQLAKVKEFHAEGGHHGHHPGGMGSGSGHRYGGHRGHGSHGGHGGHQAQKAFHEKLEPILLAQRAKLETQLSGEDKAQIAALRTQMNALHTEMQTAHQAMRKLRQADQQPTEAQRQEMEQLHTQKRTLMDQAMVIAEKYKAQIQVLHDEAMPQIEPILKEMEAQHLQHMDHHGSGSGHHAKAQGDCKGGGKSHHGPMGHQGEFDHNRKMAHFILMDPQGKSTAAKTAGITGGEAEGYGLEVYPNPSGSTNAIRYDVAKAGQVRIELMSIDGKVIKVILDDQRDAGTYSLDVNTSDLPAGSYFYRVIDASGSRVKRFAVAK